MISKMFLGGLLFVITILFCTPAVTFAQQAGSQPYKEMAEEILKLVNEHRTGMGLKPLKMNGTITASAMTHSRNMATNKVPFGHDGFNDRMEKLSKELKPSYSFAENVGQGRLDAKGAVDMWLHSPGHKKNIEDNYNLTGIGIVKAADGELYFTQIFVLKDQGK